MSYRDRTTRRLHLPSGATILVRKLSVGDFQSVGKIPGTLPEHDRAKLLSAAPDQLTPQMMDFVVKLTTLILTRCCGPIEFEGESLRIVEKTFAACAADEISIDQVDQADATEIVQAVNALSGLTKEAATAMRPFPEEPAPAADDAPAGETLRAAA